MDEHERWQRVAELVRTTRERRGMSQTDAARISGFGLTSWKKIENGIGVRKRSSLAKVTNTLGLPPDYLDIILAGEEPPPLPEQSTNERIIEELTAMKIELRRLSRAVERSSPRDRPGQPTRDEGQPPVPESPQ